MLNMVDFGFWSHTHARTYRQTKLFVKSLPRLKKKIVWSWIQNTPIFRWRCNQWVFNLFYDKDGKFSFIFRWQMSSMWCKYHEDISMLTILYIIRHILVFSSIWRSYTNKFWVCNFFFLTKIVLIEENKAKSLIDEISKDPIMIFLHLSFVLNMIEYYLIMKYAWDETC